MLKHPQRFTSNKQVVRDLQCDAIQKYLRPRLGRLSYFGLPSSSLEDVLQWSPLLERITAVERGEEGSEWVRQNELLVNAFRLGISQKLTLLRGDIDQILIKGTDPYGKHPEWPYDIVSLDYSGGLFYNDEVGKPIRLEAIEHVFKNQAKAKATDFVFLLSFNLHKIDHREISQTFAVIQRELQRFGQTADHVIDAYLKHPKEQARLKIYVMYLVDHLAIQENYETESDLAAIFYKGNQNTEMMAFRFYLKKSTRTFAPRPPKERMNQVINRRMIEIVSGKQALTNLGLPLLKANT
ncbi:MAG: hypothetical protein WAQ99_22370 [Pyrinomonadaceae bacterium]